MAKGDKQARQPTSELTVRLGPHDMAFLEQQASFAAVSIETWAAEAIQTVLAKRRSDLRMVKSKEENGHA